MEHQPILPAIDMLMHHTGKTFQEACEELEVDEGELRRYLNRDIMVDLLSVD